MIDKVIITRDDVIYELTDLKESCLKLEEKLGKGNAVEGLKKIASFNRFFRICINGVERK